MNQTERFLKDLDDLSRQPVPAPVLARARQSLQDHLAVACAGTAFQAEKLKQYFDFAQPEAGQFTAVGTGKKLALKEAVFLNGLNAHALDFDDGTNAGIIHLGTPVFALLLPLAERYDLPLSRLLHAAVLGYEASYTLAVSIQPGHKARGFHATGTCGTLGAVIAASYLLEFTQEERFRAFGAACAAASGMLMVLDDGSELKPYNAAKTALLALTALQLGKAGFACPPDPLAGRRGFFKMMTGESDIVLQPLLQGGTWAIRKTYTKAYASCRYTAPAVEAAIRLRGRFGLRASDVQSIRIRTYDLAVPGHDHTEIPGSYSAKMSIPYAAAAGLVCGKAGLQEFTEARVKDPEILGLTRKIRVEADPELSRIFPEVQAAVLELVTTTGSVLTDRVDYAKGEPENPLNEAEFHSRYLDLMDYGGTARENSEAVYRMTADGDPAVRAVTALL